jgi:hypothetical protein
MMVPAPLARLQADFASALAGADDRALAGHLVGEAHATGPQIAVYREAVRATATKALRAAFPVVVRLAGDAWFDEAARIFSGEHPSTSGDLNRHGACFPGFLSRYLHAASLPWLSDVARLEWAWHEALLAAEAGPLDLAALAAVPAAELDAVRFRLHPAARLVRSRWPILAIWEANQAGRDGTPSRDEGCDDVLVWREGGRVRIAPLEGAECALVEEIAGGAALSQLAETCGEALPELLRRHVERGVICGFAREVPGSR